MKNSANVHGEIFVYATARRGHDRGVKTHRYRVHWRTHSKEIKRTVATNPSGQNRQCQVKWLCDERCRDSCDDELGRRIWRPCGPRRKRRSQLPRRRWPVTHVYIPHLRAGCPEGALSDPRACRRPNGASPISEADDTSIAPRGPNTAAAKTVGRTEIETQVLLSRRTRPRSAIAATTARPSTAIGLPSP